MPPSRPGISGETDPAWLRLQDHLQSLTRALQDEIRTYPTPIAGCDQQFNYLLQKKRQLIGETCRINEALAHGDLPLARSIVQASEHIGEDVKAIVGVMRDASAG
jgi:hypothetical protein